MYKDLVAADQMSKHMLFWYLSHNMQKPPEYASTDLCSRDPGLKLGLSLNLHSHFADSHEPSLLDDAIITQVSRAGTNYKFNLVAR